MSITETDVESDVDSLINGMNDLSIGDVDEYEMRSFYSQVRNSYKEKFMRSADFFLAVEKLLASKSYIPSIYRNFLCAISETLESEESQLRLNEMKFRPSEKQYISRGERIKALKLLRKWRNIILEESIQEENPFFLKSGRLTSEFSDWVKSNGIRCNNFNRDDRSLFMIGRYSRDEFFEALGYFRSNYHDYDIKFLYETNNGTMQDDSFRFGDPFNARFTIPYHLMLPLPLQESFGNSGRGTAGAVLSLSLPTTLTQVDYLLTAAHVAYSALIPSYAMNETLRQKVELLNSMCNAMYVREESKCMDYALLPCQPRFIFGHAETTDQPYQLSKFRFIRNAKDIPNIWLAFNSYFEEENVKVVKRGISTNETRGTLLKSENSNVIQILGESKPYSQGGDSGALVCMEIDELELVPIGIHFQGDGLTAGAIPLWDILYNFCVQNRLTSMNVRFISPFIRGQLTFNCSEYT